MRTKAKSVRGVIGAESLSRALAAAGLAGGLAQIVRRHFVYVYTQEQSVDTRGKVCHGVMTVRVDHVRLHEGELSVMVRGSRYPEENHGEVRWNMRFLRRRWEGRGMRGSLIPV